MRRCAISFVRARPPFGCWSKRGNICKVFFLRHGRIYAGKKGWTLAYRSWLTTIRFDHSAQQVVLQDYIHAVTDAEES
jgi:hypothetical protein